MRRLIIYFIVAAFILSGCNSGIPEENVITESEKIGLEEITDRSGILDIAEDNYTKLQLDFYNFNIIVTDKSNDTQWLSNPADPESDPLVNPEYSDYMKSQISFVYIKNRARQNMHSYADSVLNEQYKIYRIDNGMRVEYTFGNIGFTVDDIPKKLTKERFDLFVTNNSLLNENDKEDISIVYDFDENEQTYNFKINSFGLKANNASKAFQKSEYTYEDLVSDSKMFDIPVEAAEKISFMIPVEYTISDGKFNAKISIPGIVNPEDAAISSINLLEFFGAQTSDEEGYIFIPDGCGALINFDQKQHNFHQIQLPVYFEDKNIIKSESTSYRENASFPVFGLKSGNKTFYSIVEDSDALSYINVTRANTNSMYNTVYPSFIIRNADTVSLGNPDNPVGILVGQEKTYNGDIKINYNFLYDDKAGYQGIANEYRNKLITEGYKAIQPEEEMPFFLELAGAVEGTKNILGISYTGLNAFTTYNQADKIVKEYNQAGIDNIKMLYSGWFNNGYYQQIPKKIKPEKILGSKDEFKNLYSGTDMYPSVQFLSFHSKKGFSLINEASRTIDQQIARLYQTNPITNELEKQDYIISPSVLSELTDNVISYFKNNNMDKMYITDMGSQFYGDYNKKNFTDKQTAYLMNIEQIKKLSENAKLIMNGATVDTGKYAYAVVNSPLYSSNYFITDEDVPFYQMVYHGLFHYAGKPINQSSDIRLDFLKSVQFGAHLYFFETFADFSDIIEAEFYQFNSTYYEQWINDARTMYARSQEVLSGLSDKQIVNYIEVAPDVYSTIYEDGTTITVNYNGYDYVTENGKVVKALDFIKE